MPHSQQMAVRLPEHEIYMTTPYSVAGIILATGQEPVAGQFPPLIQHNGCTRLETAVHNLVAGGAISVIVVLGERASEVSTVLNAMRDERIFGTKNRHYLKNNTMASIALGVRTAQALACFGQCDRVPDACIIVPENSLLVQPETYAALIRKMRESQAAVLIPHVKEKAVYPVLASSACFEHLINTRQVLKLSTALKHFANATLAVDITDPGCLAEL